MCQDSNERFNYRIKFRLKYTVDPQNLHVERFWSLKFEMGAISP
jgi:hypothetical protein